MSGFTSFASGSGANLNLNNSYETVGRGATGAGTTLTGNASANALGAYAEITASTAAAWAGFWVFIGNGSASAVRCLYDVATGAGGAEATLLGSIYAASGPTTGYAAHWHPLNVASGTRLSMRIRSATASSPTMTAAIIGVVDNAQSAPMFNSAELLVAADTAATRASSINVTTVATADTGWTQFIASTAREYGALMPNMSLSSTAPTVAQNFTLRLGTGAAASEVVFWEEPFATLTTPTIQRFPGLNIAKTVAAGTRIAAEVLAPNAGEIYCPQLIGYY